MIGRRREERYATTREYRYVYQASADESSWLFRYEYLREPPEGYRYPKAHVHVNAAPEHYRGPKPFHDLHLPIAPRGIAVECLIRHLIVEHELEPISRDWEKTLDSAQEFFATIQRRRIVDEST